MEEIIKKETAFSHMLTKVPIAYPDQTVGEVLQNIRRASGLQSADHVFVINNKEDRNLLGFVSIRVLLSSADEVKISEIILKDFPTVTAGVREDRVAILAIQHKLDVIPVVEKEKFIGAIDTIDLLRILHESHTEKLLRRAGILKDEGVVDIFRARALTLVRLRLPWLLIGLLGGMFATVLVSQFEPLLKETIALAFFIPVIAYMNGAAGTQSVTLFVRGLALEKVKISHYIVKETLVGLLIGAILGSLIFAFAFFAFGSLAVAQAVGLSMFLGISLSTLVALLVISILHATGKDPGVGADPLVTIVQDITSIAIYLFIASILVL
ncbi:hypothetical protein A2797_00135 [candidate division WWE3 bacterium RIFCSPHIGHO2_01_FULL_48_15]|uniref:CBS domain-containing protein n=1 Tax=candidate division WWE3 bacterium RIFCSPHIGHO2_01_FULL_48_15 TaxID=1802619 RepID=A0A1F4VBT5_UNCKA|nr:MAG: hypothetical protein A2797_00135 [candidate division WWE3 bacterium RIFCSPHIGHO2_01_FULL_48_15]